jgi:hypothetical protein
MQTGKGTPSARFIHMGSLTTPMSHSHFLLHQLFVVVPDVLCPTILKAHKLIQRIDVPSFQIYETIRHVLLVLLNLPSLKALRFHVHQSKHGNFFLK